MWAFLRRKTKKIKMLSVLASVSIFIFFTVIPPASAISPDQKRVLDSGVLYFDVKESDPCSNQVSVAGSGSVKAGENLYILGDSITVGAEGVYRTKLGEKLITPVINGAVGRSWTGGGIGTPTAEGSLKAASAATQDDAAAIQGARGIVIALGSNGGTASNPIDEMIDAIRQKNPTAPIWWVNTAGSSAWTGANLGYLGEFNRQLSEEATTKNYRVIDWFKAVNPAGNPNVSPTNDASGLLSDGLHPNANGSAKLAELVTTAVTSAGAVNASGTAGGSDLGCTCGGAAVVLTGDGNEEIVWNYLVGNMGFSAIQAAGIMGNIQQESGFSSTIVNKSSGAYGLIQWYAGRETALENFAREQGKDKGDLGMQLEFMKKELESPYYKSRVTDPIRATNDLATATRIWLEKFEIPCTAGVGCNPEMATRLPFAQNWLTQFGSNTGAATGGSSSGGCASPEGGTGVSADGFVFPLRTTKATITGMPGAWCSTSQSNCHHDYNAADVFAPTGTEVLSARNGTVVMAKDNDSSSSGSRVAIMSDDGNLYYYTHMGNGTIVVTNGQTVTAGTVIGRVGTTTDAMGTQQHLHIDALPGSSHSNRPACSGSGCSGLPFLNVQPALVESFNNLPG